MKKLAFYLTMIGGLIILFSFTGCDNKHNEEEAKETKAKPEPTFSLTEAKQEIVDANKQYSAFFESKDSVGLANLYTQDAKFMMDGAPSITGRKNIQSIMSELMNSSISRVDLKTVDVWGNKNLLVEEGEVSLFEGDKEVDHGKYLVLWKKIDGKWHLFRDIFNSNKEAESPL